MARDNEFEPRLGRMGRDRDATRPLAHRLAARINRAGGISRVGRGGSRFTGARLGRGAGVGRVLGASRRHAGAQARRVVVKARIVKLGGKGLGAARAHLRYIQRDGVTREGERGALYGPEDDRVDGKAFLERCDGDRHQFRFIVAPEDGAEYEALKPLVRRLMADAERDLGTRLDWVAVDHHNTGHPHSHIVVRGKAGRGKDLVIARDYLTHGLRARATELVTLDLGPRSEQEILRAQRREIDQERFTGIDRRLMRAADESGRVGAHHREPVEQSLRMGRLRTLERLGLAVEERKGLWRLDPDLEPTLRRMGERGDIIKTIHRAMTARDLHRSPEAYAVFDPTQSGPVAGRLIASGLADEHRDRRYVILDGLDGQTHYADIGRSDAAFEEGSILRLSPRPAEVRPVDRTVAEIAKANEGRYSVDIHLRHAPGTAMAFAEAHIRRLEAMRRATGRPERDPDGTWHIGADHLERAQDYERRRSAQAPVIIEILSVKSLEQLPAHDGETWLDRELLAEQRQRLGGGFGIEVGRALARREQWLVDQGLIEREGDVIRYRASLLATLHRRELERAAERIASDRLLAYRPMGDSRRIEGTYRGAVQVGDRHYAIIEKTLEFTLVPWRPVLERARGRHVSGIARGQSISWTLGRSRGLGIS